MTHQFQSDPYPSAPYPGMPMSAVSPYASWIQRVGAYLIDVAPILILEIIFVKVTILYVVIGLPASAGPSTTGGIKAALPASRSARRY